MKICKDICIIASGDTGLALSNPFDCTVYLLDGGGGELALIDTGAAIQPEALFEAIVREGFDPAQVKYAFLTHGHADHSAGAHYLHKKYGTTILAAADTAAFISNKDIDAIGLGDAIRAGVYPPDYVFEGCPVCTLKDGEVTKVGQYALKMFETPGHCDGHACYLLERDNEKLLFSGDLVFTGGRILMQLVNDCKIPEYAASIRRMKELGITALLSAHANFLLQRGHKPLEKADAIFETMAIPPNFI